VDLVAQSGMAPVEAGSPADLPPACPEAPAAAGTTEGGASREG
jgi:hypothetical protein